VLPLNKDYHDNIYIHEVSEVLMARRRDSLTDLLNRRRQYNKTVRIWARELSSEIEDGAIRLARGNSDEPVEAYDNVTTLVSATVNPGELYERLNPPITPPPEPKTKAPRNRAPTYLSIPKTIEYGRSQERTAWGSRKLSNKGTWRNRLYQWEQSGSLRTNGKERFSKAYRRTDLVKSVSSFIKRNSE